MRNGGRIFLIDETGNLRAMQETPYELEDKLQGLIERYPDLMPGDQIDPGAPRRWLLVKREIGVADQGGGGNRWSLDHLFLDQDAIPTLVEVKRASDTRIRREVLGQMLDYAANAVLYWPVEQLRAAFAETCESRSEDPDEVLDVFLDTGDSASFWKSVKTNLQAGRIRMVFLADTVPPELARIVEFLNEQMDPAEVIAVEVPRFVGDGVQTLTPRVIGVTAGAQSRKSAGERPTKQWDADSFLEALEANRGRSIRGVMERIMAWADEHLPRQWFGTGATNPSYVPTIDLPNGESRWPIALLLSGRIEVKFYNLREWPPFDGVELREEFRRKLNAIAGIDIPPERLEKRPRFDMECLVDLGAMATFLAALEWCVGELEQGALEL